jgi:branched-chain amino acid transport system substrate-binding protein
MTTRIHHVAVSGEGVANPSRRRFIKQTAATAVVTASAGIWTGYAHAAGRPIKIGFVTPKTGPLAAFAEPDDFVLGHIRKLIADGITVNGTNHPVQILERDSRSDPNRAAEVASSLIKADKVDLMVTACHVDTINPVSDQAEINGVPCVATDAPWQAYFFGRQGRPDKGFEWTYMFFWGLEDIVAVYTNLWAGLPTNKVVGALWPNDMAGNAFADAEHGLPNAMRAKGFKLVDPGRFQINISDYAAQISLFKQQNVEILTGVLSPPAFATFWSQAAQQGFKPKIATMAAAVLFPASVNALGDRGLGLSTEVNWSPYHPFKSGLTGQTAAQLCAQWEKETHKQWTQPMGYKHALFEVALDVLKRTKNIDSPEAIRDAIRETNYNSIVGHIQWTGRPVKNVAKTPLVGGQWVRGKNFKYDLVLVNTESAKEIKSQAPLKPLV